MSLLPSYTPSTSYKRFEDEDTKSNDSKASKKLSHKSNKVSDANTSKSAHEDDDVAVTCCITCCITCRHRGSKRCSVESSATLYCSSSMEGSTLSRKSKIGKAGPEYFSFPAVKGIKNLGNTCYLNSVLQCLNQTVEFHKLLSDGAYPDRHDQAYIIPSLYNSVRVSLTVTKPKLGHCGKELYYFIHELNATESPTVVKPNKLLSRIREKEKRFQGNLPQDSHEMFRFILECIRSEESEVIKDGIRKSYEPGDEEKRKEMEGCLSKAEKCCKLLNKVFVGSVSNTIICRECSNVLQLYEEIYDISVPAVKKAENTFNCYNNCLEYTTSSNYLTATEDTTVQYVDPEDEVDMVYPKSPTHTITHSDHRSGSRRSSFMGSQGEFEISMQHGSYKGSGYSTLRSVPMKVNLLGKSLDESVVENGSLCDSVQTGIIRIPQMPPSCSDAATSIAKLTSSVDQGNSNNMGNAGNEHHSNVSSPVTNMDGTDNAYLTSFNSSTSTTSNVSESVSQCIGDYATNEKQLQLHLKQNGFLYRVIRRNVDTDLEAGLQAYFELDVLDDNNKFICDKCTAERMEKRGYPEDITTSIGLSKVSKQLTIAMLPEILVLHIKRFSVGDVVSKYTTAISFPLILDMAPYCSNKCLQELGDCKKRVLYGLYGVIEHCGRGMFGGHYVAYLRRREKKIRESFVNPSSLCYNEDEAKKGEWFLANDRQVTKVIGGFDKIKNCQAYILFYERLSVQ